MTLGRPGDGSLLLNHKLEVPGLSFRLFPILFCGFRSLDPVVPLPLAAAAYDVQPYRRSGH